MTQNINLIPSQDPGLRDALDYIKKELKLELNCHHIGTIKAFNPLVQTAVVSINYVKTFLQLEDTGLTSVTTQSYPILLDCPVICLGGGLASLTFPILPGDECLLLFNDRDFDNWYNGSSSSAPATPRLHAFSDAIALVGVRSLANSLPDYDPLRAVLKCGDALVGVGGGGGTLIKVANSAFSLGGLLQDLSTQLENLTTQLQALTTAIAAITVTGVSSGGAVSGVPANAAAFVTIGTNIGTIQTSITLIATELSGLLE